MTGSKGVSAKAWRDGTGRMWRWAPSDRERVDPDFDTPVERVYYPAAAGGERSVAVQVTA